MLALVLAALLQAPAGAALHGNAQPSIVVCGRVVNEAGWTLPGVQVRAVGVGTQSADHVVPLALTAADGSFRVSILADRYVFAFVDLMLPEQRAGALYAPAEVLVVGFQNPVPGACNAGLGKPLGDVPLVAPAAGFLEVEAHDAAAATFLADATATAKLAGLLRWGAAATSATGVARVTCPLNLPTTITVSKLHFDNATGPMFNCAKANPPIVVDAFRSAVTVQGTVLDAHTGLAIEGALIDATLRVLVPAPGHPYVFNDTTGPDGAYALALPWGDTADLVANAAGYGPEAANVTLTPQDLGGGIEQPFDLARLAFVVAGTLRDFAGLGVAGDLTFTGPAPLVDEAIASAGTDGVFAIALRQGDYNVTIDAPGKNPRACSLAVDVAGVSTFAPATCLNLLALGHGAVSGRVLDEFLNTTGVPDVSASINGASSVSNGSGDYAFEAPEGNDTLTLSGPGHETATVSLHVPLDEEVTVEDITLNRGLVATTVSVRDASTNAAVRGANVELQLTDGAETRFEVSGTTDATGDVVVLAKWSQHAGILDAGDYAVDASRTDASPIYEGATCLNALDLDFSPAPGTLTCLLAAVPGVGTSVGPIRDAHTGSPLPGAQASASAPGVPCAAPYVCSATTDANGQATLQLPEDRTFTITVHHGDYQDTAATTLAGNAALVDAGLARRAITAAATLLDAHTGSPVEGGLVLADAQGFTCDPGVGGFTCNATTNADGVANLVLPWGDYDAVVEAGAFDLHLNAGVEEDARFQRNHKNFTIDTDASGFQVTLRLLRDAGDAITGTVRDHLGAVVPDAGVSAQSQRDGFVCDPADHDAPGASFPDCGGQAAVDAYSLALPHGTFEGHLWSLDATGAGYFLETATDVEQGDVLDFTLWPLRFDLVVEPREALGQEFVPFAIACITNLDQAVQSLPTAPVERCGTNGAIAAPIVFDNVTWIRDGVDDTTDTFLVRVTAPDHVPALDLVPLGPEDAAAIVPLAPLFPQVAASGGLIAGRVNDADAGLGLPAIMVSARRMDGPCVGGVEEFQTATLADGQYELPVLCTGTFEVEARDPRSAAGTPFYQAQTQVVVLEPVVDLPSGGVPSLDPGAGATANFALERVEGAVIVCVAGADGAPIEGATASAVGLATGASGGGPTGADGCVRTDALPWDEYLVTASHPVCLVAAPTLVTLLPGQEATANVVCVEP